MSMEEKNATETFINLGVVLIKIVPKYVKIKLAVYVKKTIKETPGFPNVLVMSKYL